MGKPRKRIRQTKTDFQNAFDTYPQKLEVVPWPAFLPEVLHISMALVDNSYDKVKADFHSIADYVNSKHKFQRRFHFNLSHTLELIKKDDTILPIIQKSVFKVPFEVLLFTYYHLFEFKPEEKSPDSFNSLFKGYKQILDGRSDSAILCKYIMLQYDQKDKDHFNHFCLENEKDILDEKSVVMTGFLSGMSTSTNMSPEFSLHVWMFNYLSLPPIFKPDSIMDEEKIYKEMQIDELKSEFSGLYEEFKKINLRLLFVPPVSEVNMGFVSRICNLSLDVVDLVKQHKGEIADLVFRSILENFIVGLWLLKKDDPELYLRFKDFSIGKEKFMAEKLAAKVPEGKLRDIAKEIGTDAIKESGHNPALLAEERGDAFDVNIAGMSDELWGKEASYYFLYKRSSETTHGQWRVITKHHLSRSLNPMHNGVYFYKDNTGSFSGLIPAFCCLQMATEFLLELVKTILGDTEDLEEEIANVKSIKEKLIVFHKKVVESYMKYYTSNVADISEEELKNTFKK